MATFDPVNDVSECGAYVAKYLSKHTRVKTWPKGYNRIRTSHYWPKPKRPSPSGDYVWERVQAEDCEWHATQMIKAGFDVRMGWSELTLDSNWD
jgi:hypothetical protein